MVAEEVGELIETLATVPMAAVLTDLATQTVVKANAAAGALLGANPEDLVGDSVISRIVPEERAAAAAAGAVLAEGYVDGFQTHPTVVGAEGDLVPITAWGRRIESAEKPLGLWILLPRAQPPDWPEALTGSSSVVLAMTDHDWQIEYVSAYAGLLGTGGTELRGFPLLGLVHPSAAAEFLAAAQHVAQGGYGLSLHTRLRVDGAGWAARQCLLVRMCEHIPPRLGAAITATAAPSDPRAGQLDEALHRCALEARASETLSALPALSALPHGAELSARQAEIVTHLVQGRSAAEIGRLMFLSPSTVRNHLSVIYRKFGVHSQSELLSILLRKAVSLPH